MKKLIFLISLIAVLTTTGCQNNPTSAYRAPRETQPDVNQMVANMHLPADIVVPSQLPATIQDPFLLEGWIRLYNRTQTCDLWEGHSLTGQQLAEYVIDQNVVITWNSNPDYEGSSWVDRGGSNNVYINPGLLEHGEMRMVNLVGTMAHELFHGTMPFHQGQDTLYEEYWAHYVGSCVSGLLNADYRSFNPLSADSLVKWFEYNDRGVYVNEFPLYPDEVVALSIPE